MVRYGKGPYGDARFAVCRAHAVDALDAMDWSISEIRRVDPDDTRYKCHCGERAAFYLLEIKVEGD